MRRRLIMDGKEESVAYSGTLIFEERPTENIIKFECPGCTHFAISKATKNDLKTGQAFFASIIANTNILRIAASTNAGTTISMGNEYETNNSLVNYPYVTSVDDGIELKVKSLSDTARWFQAGTYEWIAW